MTETQDVLERTRRRRRHAPAILLGGLPVVIASTALVGAYTFVPTTSSYALDTDGGYAAAPAPVESITADDAGVDTSPKVPKITVKVPPPPEPEPAPAAAYAPASSGTTSSGTASSSSSSSVDFAAYCSSPSSPASASSASGLLAAANAERARLGMAPLTWSSSLASAAAGWSQTMAAKDSGTSSPADALSHNPNRPGGENVGVVYRSTGYSEGAAMAKIHASWMYSYGHCTNIMNPAYTQMGAGAAVTSDGTTWYATENFR